ncbi:MFS transporter [Longirhabdus pacifica]|uniref:MFS transporter n=1 Tax=Longirhabdus pacifica TaxID=2305227 RepID=UPI0010087877
MELFKNKQFVKLFCGSFLSQMGSIIGNAAIAFYLLDVFTSQPGLATLAELMYALPTIFVFLFVGVIADKLDRKKIAIYSDWIRAGLTALLIAAVMMNWLFLVFVLLFVRAGISKFFMPAEIGMVQGVVSKEAYQQAAGLNQMVYSIFMIFGVGLGALAYRTIGIQGALVIDGLSFIASAFFIQTCNVPLEARQPNGKYKLKDISFRSSWEDFKSGVSYVWNNKLLLSILSGFFLFGLINGAFAVLPMFTMKYKLAPEQFEWYAALFSICLGVGIFIGSMVTAVFMKKVKPYQIIIASLFITTILVVFLALSSEIWVYLCFAFGLGFILAPMNIAISGWILSLVESTHIGRVEGLIDPSLMLSQSIMLGAIAVAFPNIISSVDVIYFVLAALFLVVSLYYAIKLPSLVRNNEESKTEEIEGQTALEG